VLMEGNNDVDSNTICCIISSVLYVVTLLIKYSIIITNICDQLSLQLCVAVCLLSVLTMSIFVLCKLIGMQDYDCIMVHKSYM